MTTAEYCTPNGAGTCSCRKFASDPATCERRAEMLLEKKASSMTPIQFVIPGQPEAKGRPRFRIIKPKQGAAFVSTYTPSETVKNEERIAQYAKIAMKGSAPCEMPIEILIELRMQIPGSWSKKKQVAASAGQVRATKKPDIDNCAKSILDACNGVVFCDDGQVVQLTLRKLYHAEPCVIVAVRQVEGEAA